MIRNFNDHAANERTFLAWVRTALAVMAFGFLVEKFDLLIRLYLVGAKGADKSALPGGFAGAAGLALIAFGIAAIFVAMVRFRIHAHDIESVEEKTWHGGISDILLALLLVGLGLGLGVYLLNLVLR